jgi:non-specific serine/threonine protein kinase
LLVDLGPHRLKDLRDAEHLYQVDAPGLQHSFPPLSSVVAVPNNLPVYLSSFVGRERERRAARELLERTRLLTLSGPGGAGKTRLAAQIAADMVGQFSDGVWMVELAPITDPALVPRAVASVLGLRDQPGRSLDEFLADFLSRRRLLLVLDNAEHVVDAVARFVERYLRAAPGVKILATSREVIGVPGETVYPVPPLSCPPTDGPPAPEQVAAYESVALFLDRARAVAPGFAVTRDNAAALGEICRRLDGIPLAIELAAARVRVLAPTEIAMRLGDRFRLLADQSRTAPPRHRTLQAALDWSHELLTDPERRLFRRLAVFSGGFSLEAAEAVDGSGAGDDSLELLARLADKSLVVVDAGPHAARYRLLETVRLYAEERLTEAGEAEGIKGAHFDYFHGVVCERGAGDPDDRRARGMLLAREHDNLRAALDWGVEARPPAALDMAAGLWRFWGAYGHLAEGWRRLTRAVAAAPEAPDTLRAEALLGAGRLATLLGDLGAGRELIGQSRKVAEGAGLTLGVARATEELGDVAQRAGDQQAARTWLVTALELYRAVGKPEDVARVLSDIGHGYWHDHELSLARSYAEESLALVRSSGHATIEALWTLGLVARDEGDLTAAAAWYEKALELVQDAPVRPDTAELLEARAGAAVGLGDHLRAARLFAAAEALRESIQYPVPESHRDDVDEPLARLRRALPAEDLARAWQEGRAMTARAAVTHARSA